MLAKKKTERIPADLPPPQTTRLENWYAWWTDGGCLYGVVVAVLLVLPLAQFILPTPQDVKTFYNWLIMADERGLWRVYTAWTNPEVIVRFHDFNVDYPPAVFLYFPLFKAVQWVTGQWPAWPSVFTNLLFRVPIALTHVLVFVAMWRSIDRTNRKARFLLSLLFGMNPAILLLSIVWGQLDIALWGVMFCAIQSMEAGKAKTSGAWAAVGALIKPQFILYAPILLATAIRKRRPAPAVTLLGTFFIALLALSSPFLLTTGWAWFFRGYSRALAGGEWALSTTSHNFWWLVQNFTHLNNREERVLGITCKNWGLLFSSLILIPAGIRFLRDRKVGIAAFCTLALLTYYTVMTGLTAKFVVSGLCAIALWASLESDLIPVAVLLSLCGVEGMMHNALIGVQRYGGYINVRVGYAVTYLFSVVVIAGLAVLVGRYFRGAKRRGGKV